MLRFFLIYLFIFPFNLHAYFDPGSASVVIQAIIASIVAVGAYISIYFRKFNPPFITFFTDISYRFFCNILISVKTKTS